MPKHAISVPVHNVTATKASSLRLSNSSMPSLCRWSSFVPEGKEGTLDKPTVMDLLRGRVLACHVKEAGQMRYAKRVNALFGIRSRVAG